MTTTTHQLEQCAVCGRFGWHSSDKCPEGSDFKSDQDLPDSRLRDVHRRIRNILKLYPAADWTQEESSAVLDALAGIVRRRQPSGPDLPIPAGAVEVHDWTRDHGQARHFLGTSRLTAEDVTGSVDFFVDIAGDQDRDGTIERYIHINGDHPLSVQAAREVGGALIAAADECEQMNGYDPVTVD